MDYLKLGATAFWQNRLRFQMSDLVTELIEVRTLSVLCDAGAKNVPKCQMSDLVTELIEVSEL